MSKERNHKGYWLMYGVFKKALPYIKHHFTMLRGLDEDFKLKTVQYEVFYTVIKTYLTIVFERIVAGEKVKLWGRTRRQSLQVVKTKPLRYEPSKKHIRRNADGTYNVYEKKIDYHKTDGFMYFVFWDSPKKYRTHKFYAHGTWKAAFMRKVFNEGFDYEDKTLPTGTWADYKILKSMQCNDLKV